MTMIEAMRRVSKKAFFSKKRLAEDVVYNEKTISALCYIGATLSRTDWNDAATSIEHASLADLSVFIVCDTDVANPEVGDNITYKGITYSVANVMSHDEWGAQWVLSCSTNERAYGRK